MILIKHLYLVILSIIFIGYQSIAYSNSILFKKPDHRIISLAPNITEIVYAAGAGNYLVGVDQASDYPLAATKLPKVGSYNAIDFETIRALNPDLIIAPASIGIQQQLKKLQTFGIRVVISDIHDLSDIPRTIEQIGELSGTSSIAKHSAVAFNRQYQQLWNSYSTRSKLNVFYQLWYSPLMTVGSNNVIDQIITICGGKNIFPHTFSAMPIVNLEDVLAKNPDVIISNESTNWKKPWQQWPTLSAVKNQNFYSIPADLLQRPGPRLMQGAQMLCADLEQARQSARFNSSPK